MEPVALTLVICMQSFWMVTCLVLVYFFIRRCRTIRDRRRFSAVGIPSYSITSITPPTQIRSQLHSAPENIRRLSTVSMPAFNVTSMTPAVPRSHFEPDRPSHSITPAKEMKCDDLEYGLKLETSKEGVMEERLELDIVSTKCRPNRLFVPQNC